MTARPAMKRVCLAVIGLAAICAGSLRAQAPAVPLPHPTPAERADYRAFTAPAEVGPYLGRLAEQSEGVSVDSLEAPTPLPIVRLAPLGSAGSDAVRVLVLAAQHGTERAGVESALRLARDLAVGALGPLRDRLDVRIVPMANPWGVANRRRLNPDGVDLDRDHVRLSAPETRALWAEYTAWRPHVVLDLHELGPGEYGLQAATPTHPNAPGARTISHFYLLPSAANELARADVRFHEYVASWLDGHTAEASALPAPDSLEGRTWFTPPPLDPSSARNAFGLAGSAVLFLATASSRDIIGLRDRTDRLHTALVALLAAAASHAPDVRAAHAIAKAPPKDSLVLRSEYVPGAAGAGLPWMFVNERGQVGQEFLAPWRSSVEIERRLAVPAGWWVDRSAVALIESLRGHGFEVDGSRPAPTRAIARAYAGCAPGGLVEAAPPADAHWVEADQAGARLLFTLIEPWSDGGWFAGESGGGSAGAWASACREGESPPVWRATR